MQNQPKSEKLYDGITNIRDDLIHQARPPAAHFPTKWRLAAMAAVLAVAICAGILLQPSGGSVGGLAPTAACTIAKAAYPQSAPYPDETIYTRDDGSFDDSSYNQACDAWWEDTSSRRKHIAGYADAMDRFLSDSIRQFLSTSADENLAYSPLNLYTALGMLTELTDRNSRAQILALLDCKDMQTLRDRVFSLWNANYCDDGATTRILANSLWLNASIRYTPSTLESLAKNYYASSYRGEMGSAEYNRMLQDWLNAQTGGLLTKQASQLDLLKENTALALASTVYFRGKWMGEFSADNTAPQTFHAASEDITCDFMHKEETATTYFWGNHFSAVSQSLGDSGSMWFVLPDEGVSVEELLNDRQAMDFLISNDRQAWESQTEAKVNLAVPKFDISSQLDLPEGLKALGVTDVFDAQKADFSPMTADTDGVYLSRAKHAVRVAVDEQGVTAAAYTVMAMTGAGMQQPDEVVDFVLDRPFLFLITDAAELPLFVGIVQHP